MPTDTLPLHEYGLDAAAELLTRAFADYFVKLPFTSAALLQLARTDSVDLASSRVLRVDGAAVGAALVARRGWTSRVAGMALVPAARQRGLGAAFMERLADDARARGERAMVLEVIEQNAPAVRLYEKCGFKKHRRLVGFAFTPADDPGRAAAATAAPAAGPLPEEIDLRAAAQSLAPLGADWPWQLSGETVAQLTPPAQGFRLADAWVAVSGLAGPDVVIRAVAPVPSLPALLRALRAQRPLCRWRIAALWPEEHAPLFTAAGFQRTELTQWQMARLLR